MTPYMLAMLFLAATLALIVLEMFVPSGGFLSFLAVAALTASIVVIYYHRGFAEGTIYLVLVALLIPAVVIAALNWWPHTPIGRRILNIDPEGYVESVENPYEDLIGKRGTAITQMLLSGSIRVDGTTYDAVSDGQAIEPGQTVVIVSSDGNRILVRPDSRTGETDNEGTSSDFVADVDPLSRPASEIIGDAFDEPLA